MREISITRKMSILVQGRDVGLVFTEPGDGTMIQFDLGVLYWKDPRRWNRIRHFFISHAHIDHLIYFDWVLRFLITTSEEFHFYGPRDFIEIIYHRLNGYSLNLLKNAEFRIHVHEFHDGVVRETVFLPERDFIREEIVEKKASDGLLFSHSEFNVRATVLDHSIPVLSFVFEEPVKFRVDPERVRLVGFEPGPWLKEYKEKAVCGCPFEFTVDGRTYSSDEGPLLGDLVKGTRYLYVTDTIFREDILNSILSIGSESDIVVCEAGYLHEDLEQARENFHLTARQAGIIAREARAKRLILVHPAGKFKGREHELVKEAMKEFRGQVQAVN